MLHTKFRGNRPTGSGEDFEWFLPYMGVAAILVLVNNDLCRNHLRDSPLCDCLDEIEDAEHYLFRCRRFTIPRLSLFQKTRHLHPLNTHLLLNGNSNLSYDDNVILFEAVQKFIKDTARFNT